MTPEGTITVDARDLRQLLRYVAEVERRPGQIIPITSINRLRCVVGDHLPDSDGRCKRRDCGVVTELSPSERDRCSQCQQAPAVDIVVTVTGWIVEVCASCGMELVDWPSRAVAV